MLSRTVISAVFLGTLALATLSCTGSQPTPSRTSVPTYIPAAPTATGYLTQEIPPCTPVSGTAVDPCEPDAPPFEMGAANSLPLLGVEPASIREMLDDDPPLPGWMTHLVLRGTYLPGTVRCSAGDRFRPPQYLQDEFVYTANSRGFKCYADVRVNSYVLGGGPSSITAMLFKYTYFDGEFALYSKERQTEEEIIEQVRLQFEAAIDDFFPGREHVMFLGPPADLSSRAWRLMGFWDVQRQENDTVVVVHPQRDDWRGAKPDEYQTYLSVLEMDLPAFTQAVTTANQARVTEYGGRIGADADLPMLVGNANQLRDYYTEVGAYDTGVPAPVLPPPPCGLAVPDQGDNAGLMRDCINLLAAKDALRGTATLNWSVDVPISDWDGVSVEGSPSRVTRLLLNEKGLNGIVAPELARLDGLEYLRLAENQLTGCIPLALRDVDDNDLDSLGLKDCEAVVVTPTTNTESQ